MNLTQSFLGMCTENIRILFETKLTEEDFPDPIEQKAFMAMKQIALDGGALDNIALKNAGIPLEFISNLDTQISSSWRSREKQVIEASKKRQIARLIEKVQSSMALPSKDLHDIISHEMGKIDRRGDYEIRYVSDVGANGIAEITERSKNNGKMVGLSTGFSLLDYCTFGFQKRKLYYVGGRPSQGKTSLLVNFAVNCNDRFGFLSAESGADEILIKLFAKYGNIDSRKLELGTRDSKEFSIMANYVDRESELKSVIYDKPNMDIDDLSFIARSMVESYGCKILFVDYIQILGASFSMKKKDRREQIADISMKLKQLARDLNVPVVVAAQLTRDADKDRPELSSFGESSQIEKDADVAILIWKSVETRTLESKEKVKDTKTYLLLDKNRDGKTAKIEVYFNGASQTFEQI